MSRLAGGVLLLLFALGSSCTESVVPVLDGLAVDIGSLEPARQSFPYSVTLSASGGQPPYEWHLGSKSMSPPAGLRLSVDGEIAGIPQSEGTWDFAVAVRSADGRGARQRLSVTVWPSEAPVLEPAESCSAYPGWALATFEDARLEALIGGAKSCDELAQIQVVQSYTDTIGSLVGLQNLRELVHLDLNFTDSIRDVSPLRDLSHLFNVFMPGNAITDPSPLSGHDELKDLRLDYNAISDLSGLVDLPSLERLRLGDNQITDITPLGDLRSLTLLGLAKNDISDISALSALTHLGSVSLAGNRVTDVAPLSGLPELWGLALGGNGLTDISALTDFAGLHRLFLESNGITDIGPLTGLTNLTELRLNGNALADIEPLHALTGLTVLGLGNNALADIGPLSGLTNVRSLELNDNQITDLTALVGLTNLAYLDLSGNLDLADIQPLLDNPGLPVNTPWVDGFDLRATRVSCSDIAALQARGVHVDSDCP